MLRLATHSTSSLKHDMIYFKNVRYVLDLHLSSSVMTLITKIVRCVFWFVSLLGCAHQISNIISVYFHYDVVTETTLKIFLELKAPELSVCIRYIDLFDYKQYSSDKNYTFKFVPGDYGNQKNETFDQVTVGDIFNYTPPTKGLFKSCTIKVPGKYGFIILTGKDCDDVMSVRKYYYSEFVCYAFLVRKFENDTYHYSHAAYALVRHLVLYDITLDEQTFRKADFMRLFMTAYCDGKPGCTYTLDRYPVSSFAYGDIISRGLDEHYNALSNIYAMDHFTVTHIRLPLPYREACISYRAVLGFTGKSECLCITLLQATMDAFNKTPFSCPITGRLDWTLDRKHVSISDINKRGSLVSDIERRAMHKCRWFSCTTSTTLTRTAVLKLPVKTMSFRIHVPKEPSLVIKYKARLLLAEAFIYITSTISIWLGVSYLSLYHVYTYITAVLTTNKPVHKKGKLFVKCNKRMLMQKTAIISRRANFNHITLNELNVQQTAILIAVDELMQELNTASSVPNMNNVIT